MNFITSEVPEEVQGEKSTKKRLLRRERQE